MKIGNKKGKKKIEEIHFENLLKPIDTLGNMKILLPIEKAQQIIDAIDVKGLEENKQIITADIRKDQMKRKTSNFIKFINPIVRCDCNYNPPDFDIWLDNNPNIRDAIKFQFDNGEILSYPDWNNTIKYTLKMAFESAWINQTYENLLLPDPLPNYANLEDDDQVFTVTAGVFACHLFLAHLAVCLANEIKGRLPWSIRSYNTEELENLFDCTQMFQLISNINNTYVGGYLFKTYSFGRAIPAPPSVINSFLASENLYTLHRMKAISNIINWCRENLTHYLYGPITSSMDAQWHYRGDPPVSRIIKGTTSTFNPEWGKRHFTAGCHGTNGFLRSICRVINIPVKKMSVRGHALPCFINDDLYLSHGDDPYNGHSKITPLPSEENLIALGETMLPPAERLLIVSRIFHNWFGVNVSVEDQENNIGRQVRELAIEYLSDILLHAHCRDLEEDKNHEDSWVYNYCSLDRNYSVSELEDLNLWDRIEAKIAAWGGCQNLPKCDYFPSP